MVQKATGTMAVGNMAKIAAIRYGEREALVCTSTGRRYSFKQINERVNRLANGLMGMGLRKGDTAAFLCTNRAEIVEIYFALAKIGVVGIPLNYRLAPAEMIDLMVHCEAKAFLFDIPFFEVAGKVRTELSRIEHFVGLGDCPDFAVKYEELLAGSPAGEPDVEVFEEDNQYMNLTSGTTGIPKSYFLTHYNNATAVSVLSCLVDLKKSDVILTVFPMFGRVGFAWTAGGILSGAKNVIMNFNPQQVLEIIQNEKVTVTNWVPTMASFILMVPELGKYDLSSLRGIVYAGSALPPRSSRKRKNGYAQTFTSITASRRRAPWSPWDPRKRRASPSPSVCRSFSQRSGSSIPREGMSLWARWERSSVGTRPPRRATSRTRRKRKKPSGTAGSTRETWEGSMKRVFSSFPAGPRT